MSKSRAKLERATPLTCAFAFAATSLVWFALSGPQARAQRTPSGAQVRGIFLETRPVRNAPNGAPPNRAGAALAFGYTLFQDDPLGPRRVGFDHVFHRGDGVRILVETNHDAYLYVFQDVGRRLASLLFPSTLLRGGENRLQAHESAFVPGQGWFRFDKNPGDEHLMLIVTEQPLPAVPRGRELTSSGFRLTQAQLDRLAAGSRAVSTATQTDEGARMSPAEGRRGLILTSDDPPPSKIVMKESAKPGRIVARLVLIHR